MIFWILLNQVVMSFKMIRIKNIIGIEKANPFGSGKLNACVSRNTTPLILFQLNQAYPFIFFCKFFDYADRIIGPSIVNTNKFKIIYVLINYILNKIC